MSKLLQESIGLVANWLRETARLIGRWLGFAAGLVLGVVLAFIFYAGLQPRIQQAVAEEQKAEQAAAQAAANKRAAEKALLAATAKAVAPTPAPVRRPAQPVAVPTAAVPKPGADSANYAQPAGPRQLTRLPVPAGAPGMGWKTLLVASLVAFVAGVVALQQYWKRPRPDIRDSPVLEALLKLEAHQLLLKEHLRLSPRQIKRLNSKARVQHSQLQALAPKTAGRAVFPVATQIQAVQLLLLLEENRQQATRFPPHDPDEFIRQLQAAYLVHAALTKAREQAAASPIITAGQAAATPAAFASLNQAVDGQLLRKLYEMNAGLLA